MNSLARIVMVTCCATLLVSCIHFGRKDKSLLINRPVPEVSTDLTVQSEKIGEVRDDVTSEANASKTDSQSIQQDTVEGEKIAPAPQWASVREKAQNIQESQTKIIERANELTGVQVKLGTAKAEVEELTDYTKDALETYEGMNAKIGELEKQVADYETGVKKQQQNIMMVAVAVGGVMALVGLLLCMYVSPKAGSPLIIAGLVVSSVAYFMARYAWIVALAGGIIFVMIIGYVIYFAASHRKALIESMQSFELIKPKDWSQATTKKAVSDIQSNRTKRVIRELKFKENIG